MDRFARTLRGGSPLESEIFVPSRIQTVWSKSEILSSRRQLLDGQRKHEVCIRCVLYDRIQLVPPRVLRCSTQINTVELKRSVMQYRF